MVCRAVLVLLAASLLVVAVPAEAARKALVLGNAAHPTQRLANPVNDATDVAAQLKALGYEVTLATDATRTRMTRTVLDFRRRLAAGDEAVVFYAGHGMQVRGQNFLIPVDADPREEAEVEAVAVALDWVLRNVAESGARSTLVLLDACRNNPYTAAWLAALAEPGLTHHRILDRVHLAVKKATGDRQETWQEGQLTGELVLNRAAAAAADAPATAFDPRLVELRFWESVERGGTRADYEAYLARYPDGEFSALAKGRLVAADQEVVLASPPTASEIAAIRDSVRQQVAPCWSPPTGSVEARDMIVRIHARLDRTGQVIEARVIDADRGQSNRFFEAAVSAARRAVLSDRCNPLDLPEDRFELWSEIDLTFDPRSETGRARGIETPAQRPVDRFNEILRDYLKKPR